MSVDRAALVTGASSGIGLAIARMLGEEGYALTVSARRAGKLEAAAEELRAAGLKVRSVVADLAEEEDVIRVVAEHREAYGRLDVLVNNAGMGASGRIERIETERLDRALAVNLRAAVLATREALPILRESDADGKKLVVNVASITGKAGKPGLSIYAATKAALINFTQSTQREVAGAGIQCTALAPSFVDTPMAEFAKARIPGEKMIRSEDIAEAVRFLLRTSSGCRVPELAPIRPGGL